MGKLLRRTLDEFETVAEWSPGDQASVEAAEQKLREEMDAGYMAVLGGENTPVTELPPDAEEVILTIPMGGG